MSANRFPIVGDTTQLGEAARVAAGAKVGAVLVASTSGMWLVPIKDLPGQEAEIGSVASALGRGLASPGFVAPTEFTLKSIADGLAEIEFDASHPWNLNVSAGYKECTVNTQHTFPPSYRRNDCPYLDTGTLVLKP